MELIKLINRFVNIYIYIYIYAKLNICNIRFLTVIKYNFKKKEVHLETLPFIKKIYIM